MVTRIDRLARSIGDLQDIVRSVKAKGATLKATEQPFDTGNIYGELTVNLLAVSLSSRRTFAKSGRLKVSRRLRRRGL
jgi:DNA invertase Pin-like site-specific DNA recombinase